MSTEIGRKHIEEVEKWCGRLMASAVNSVDIFERISGLNLQGAVVSLDFSGIDINYRLAENEDLLYISNQILEAVEGIIEFGECGVVVYEGFDYGVAGFNCREGSGIEINIRVDFSGSKSCNVDFVNVISKKAVLSCK